MKVFSLIRALLCLGLVLLPLGSASAAWYQVELIAFRQASPTGDDFEATPTDPPPPSLDARVAQLAASSGYTPLPASQFRLQSVYQSLQRSNLYQPLLHVAWRQQAQGRAETSAVAIPQDWSPDGPPPQGPYGLVRVYQQRFMHVELDLRLPDDDGVHVNRQSRRIKSGELEYLDHPTLGVILLVTPL